MTFREKFCAINSKRGYKVENLGLITILSHDNYRAYHFFNPDGSIDKTKEPYWTIEKS